MLKSIKKDNKLQYEFLPAALEISETPSAPLGRFVIWSVFFIITFAIIWAYFGKVDEVAVARGQVIPDGRLKVVQTLEEGIITAIHVNEGQRVKQGQLLIELDATMKKVDAEIIEEKINTIRLEKNLFSKILDGGDMYKLVSETDISEVNKNNLLKFFQAKDTEVQVQKQLLEMEVLQTEEQLQISKSDLHKLTISLQLI